jgi:hypoxia up-regulated 1
LKNLLGRLFTDKDAEQYRQFYDNTMLSDPERGTCSFQHDKDTVYSVEELVAMQLANARKDAEAFTGEAVRDVVFTVCFI